MKVMKDITDGTNKTSDKADIDLSADQTSAHLRTVDRVLGESPAAAPEPAPVPDICVESSAAASSSVVPFRRSNARRKKGHSATGALASLVTSRKKRKTNLYRIPRRLTYAAVVDRHRREREITDFMVRRACDEMDSAQQFPFAPLPA